MTRTPVTRSQRARLVRPTLAAIALGLVALFATPLAADAHASLVASSPEDGARVTTTPSAVTFTFDEPVTTPAFVAVSAPDGTRIELGDPVVLDATVSQEIDPVDQRGVYTMAFRVLSDDGHPVSDSLTFTVTSGRDVTQVDPASALADDPDSSSMATSVVLVVTAFVAIVIVSAVLFVMTRQRPRERPQP